MAINLTVNGVSYPYPQTGDNNWGAGATNWASAVTSGMLSLAGGSFSLTAEVDFGSNFGLKALYLKSETTNISGTGYLRLANADAIGWRNSGNTADLTLKPDADGILQYNSIDLVNLSATQTLTNKTLSSPAFSGNVEFPGKIGIGSSGASQFSGAAVTARVDAASTLSPAYRSQNFGGSAGAGGGIEWTFSNSLSTEVIAGQIGGSLTNGTSGSEASDMLFKNVSGGTLATRMTLSAAGNLSVTGTIGGSNLSGSNTGDQTITLTGDVTGSGTGSFATAIGAGKVTNTMLAGSIAYSKLVLTGAILNADLAGSIADTKLSTISTAGKVADSALPTSMATKTFTGTTTFPTSSMIDTSGNATFGGGLVITGTSVLNGGIAAVTTNSSAATGIVGQFVNSAVASGSAVSLTNGAAANVTSISLPAGDWDVSAIACFIDVAAWVATQLLASINTTSATLGTSGDNRIESPAIPNAASNLCMSLPPYRVSLASAGNAYLVVQGNAASGSGSAYGRISARRVR